MDYVFVLRGDASAFARLGPTQLRASVEAFTAFTTSLSRTGALRSALHLKDPMTATTLTHDGRRVVLHDGSGELGPQQLTGLYIVSAPSLDEALALADDCPILKFGGSVEVRPLYDAPSSPRRHAPRPRRPSRSTTSP
ncbi:MAG: YciI family protein [Myxococcaceae bacterium]|nr:YciI family protein [Myxococcaceae bacterium]